MLLLQKGFTGEAPAILAGAENVTVTEKLNDEKILEFRLPYGNKYGVDVSRCVECDGEVYVVLNVTDNEDDRMYTYKCQHEFVYMAKRRHFPNIASTDSGDFIGVAPYVVMEEAQRLTHGGYNYYNLAPASELENNGMYRLGGNDNENPDFIIDFESVDKTTLWDVILQVVECAGYGELFYSSKFRYYTGALAGIRKAYGVVERIGRDTDIVISPQKNANSISIEYDITDMITVLYPYGKDDMEITNAEKNTSGTNYIISDNESKYGWAEGYKSYDHSDPDDLFDRALWEFDAANPNRLDVPSVNISGSVAELGITSDIHLGDIVTVLDKGISIRERIIEIKRYPFSGKPAEISIGRPAHDMFFYLRQVGTLAQRYKNISVNNGKIYGTKVTGTVTATTETARTLNNDTGQIVIDGSGLRVLSSGRLFLAASKNNFSVGEAIVINSAGYAEINIKKLALNGYNFTIDTDGNLYFDGKMVQLVKEDTNNG